MKAYIDPENSNQVMAMYSHGTASEKWESEGYELVDVDPSIREVSRDHQAVVEDGVIVDVSPSVNPVQPAYTDTDEQNDVRALAETRKSIERINQEISEGNIPDRTSNANVDVVLSEWEDEASELRSRIS